MMFTDLSGDAVGTSHASDAMFLECYSIEEDGSVVYRPLFLDASMARTLAVDLIAFADSQQQETENEG